MTGLSWGLQKMREPDSIQVQVQNSTVVSCSYHLASLVVSLSWRLLLAVLESSSLVMDEANAGKCCIHLPCAKQPSCLEFRFMWLLKPSFVIETRTCISFLQRARLLHLRDSITCKFPISATTVESISSL